MTMTVCAILSCLQYQLFSTYSICKNFINHTPANYPLIEYIFSNGVFVLIYIFLFLKAEFTSY